MMALAALSKKLKRQERTCLMFKLNNPLLPAEQWDAFDSDDDSDEPVQDEHHAICDCPGCV